MDHDSPNNTTPQRGGIRAGTIAAIVGPLLAIALVWWAVERRRSDVTIGVEGQKIIEIAGPQLAAAPFTPGDAVSVRIAEATPVPGGYRYDLRYVAYGPGPHNLAPTLSDEAGKPLAARDDLAIDVPSLLPSDHQGDLYPSSPSKINLHSNYVWKMAALWVLWALLLVPLYYYGRKRRVKVVSAPPLPSVAERLRTLLTQASTEHLSVEQQADLEQLLMAFWSQRLNLSTDRLSELIERLKTHPQAGKQWNRVERWFHSRATTTNGAIARELLQDLDTLN